MTTQRDPVIPAVGGVLACAACCAAPLAAPYLASVGAGAALGWISGKTEIIGLAALAIGFGLAWRARQRAAPGCATCPVDASCGCASGSRA